MVPFNSRPIALRVVRTEAGQTTISFCRLCSALGKAKNRDDEMFDGAKRKQNSAELHRSLNVVIYRSVWWGRTMGNWRQQQTGTLHPRLSTTPVKKETVRKSTRSEMLLHG